ncbi:potassium channel family protein [Aurantimonas sp. A2-1-M11]|uniref:potassium channel family protein n=1 Tax=Aurantimonas sp. A2-1-M11 TaxID=3113712 RepID=UPI002F944C90
MALLSLLGAAIVAWTIVELGLTTLTAQGAGPLTARSMQWGWRLALAITGGEERRHRLLTLFGPLILAGAALIWFLGLWLGWWLVFLGSGDGILNAQTRVPADAQEMLYFTGYTLATLGLGDYQPTGALWQMLTTLCAANGLLALTLSVTYLVPVISAAVAKRQLAILIHGLGSTPDGILTRCAQCGSYARLGSILDTLSPDIVTLGQQHLAYPALHYFHSPQAAAALPLRLAALSEAIDSIAATVPADKQPDSLAMMRCQSAISSFLWSLQSGHIRLAEDEPPRPHSHVVAPPAPAHELKRIAAGQAGSVDRRLLLSLIESDGWHWRDINFRNDDDGAMERRSQTPAS